MLRDKLSGLFHILLNSLRRKYEHRKPISTQPFSSSVSNLSFFYSKKIIFPKQPKTDMIIFYCIAKNIWEEQKTKLKEDETHYYTLPGEETHTKTVHFLLFTSVCLRKR
jgi:hypothetical protein